MNKEKILKGLAKLTLALVVNSIVGIAVGTLIFGASPLLSAIVANVIAALASPLMPQGVILEGVLTEVWTGEMIKAFRTDEESTGWYERIRSYDEYVTADVIHFVELGGDPKVLVNNSTYPLEVTTLEDADKPVSLDLFETEATAVTAKALYGCSYDLIDSVVDRHKCALREEKRIKAIHAIAPDTNVAGKTPVVKTTGEALEGRKTFTVRDLIELKRQADKMGMPMKDRILVLTPDHSNDLLNTCKNYADHYNINDKEGKITRLYSFDIYEYEHCPYFTYSSLKKLAYGKVPSDETDVQASVAFHLPSMMKANGSLNFYHSEAKHDPLHHRNLVNFDTHSIAMPLKSDYTRIAIVSDKAV